MIVFLAKYRISRRQMVVMESPATLRKITLCGELRDRFEPVVSQLESFKL